MKKKMFTPQILYLHSQLAPDSYIERFVDLLDPKTVGLTDKSQFYAPVQFTVQVCGGINAAAGAIRLDVPVHANPNWLQVMKNRFSGMCGITNPKSLDFKTITGQSISEFAPDDLSRVGKLNVFVNDKLLRLPEMPTVPVEFSVSKANHIQKWFNEKVAPALPEAIASQLAKCTSEHEINQAIEPNGAVQKTIEKSIRASLDGGSWTEFVRTHHMNSPTYMPKDFSADTLKTISTDMLYTVRQFVGAASGDIEAYLSHLRSKKMTKDPDFAPVLGKVNNNTPKINGQKMYNKLMQDAFATPAVLHNVVNTLFTQPIGRGCRWDEDKPITTTTTSGGGGGGGGNKKMPTGGIKRIDFETAFNSLNEEQKRKVALVIEAVRVNWVDLRAAARENNAINPDRLAQIFFAFINDVIVNSIVAFTNNAITNDIIQEYLKSMPVNLASSVFFDALYAAFEGVRLPNYTTYRDMLGGLSKGLASQKSFSVTYIPKKYELYFSQAKSVVLNQKDKAGDGLVSVLKRKADEIVDYFMSFQEWFYASTPSLIIEKGLARYDLSDPALAAAKTQENANSYLFGNSKTDKVTTQTKENYERWKDSFSEDDQKINNMQLRALMDRAVKNKMSIPEILTEPGLNNLAVQLLNSDGIPISNAFYKSNIAAALYNLIVYGVEKTIPLPQPFRAVPRKEYTDPKAADKDKLPADIYKEDDNESDSELLPIDEVKNYANSKTRTLYESIVNSVNSGNQDNVVKYLAELNGGEDGVDFLLILRALNDQFKLQIDVDYESGDLEEIYDTIEADIDTEANDAFLAYFSDKILAKTAEKLGTAAKEPEKPKQKKSARKPAQEIPRYDIRNVTQAKKAIVDMKNRGNMNQKFIAVVVNKFPTAISAVDVSTLHKWAKDFGVPITKPRQTMHKAMVKALRNKYEKELEHTNVKSRIESHHPWNALIHHSLYPVNGAYPTYYNVLHTKQDMSKDAPYVGGDLNETYKYYHMFMGGAMMPPGKVINQPLEKPVSIESKMRERLVPIAARPPLIHISKIKPAVAVAPIASKVRPPISNIKSSPVRVAPVRARLVDVGSEETISSERLHYTQLPSVNDVFDD